MDQKILEERFMRDLNYLRWRNEVHRLSEAEYQRKLEILCNSYSATAQTHGLEINFSKLL